jgi:C4-dicarboxylate transporter, DctM subunit
MTVFLLLAGVFVGLMAIGVPIAIAMGLGATAAVFFGTDLPLVIVGQRLLVILDSFPFLALPFFVVAGLFMEKGGVTSRLVNFAALFVGRMPGGLAQVVVGTNLGMAGASGSATADCAATGSVLIPALSRAGYPPNFAAAVTAAAATLGAIIPPSVMFVIYGSITNTSISALFVGGLVPGVIMAFYMFAANFLIAKRRDYPRLESVSRAEAWVVTREAMPALLMPVIVIGGIVGGVFTPTEAGAVAAVYAFILSIFIYREMRWYQIVPILTNAAILTAAIMLVVSASEPFGWVLGRERIPEAITQGFSSFTTDTWMFLLATNILLLLFGMVFEPIPLMIIMAPVLVPLLHVYDVDPVHFGVIITLNMSIGLLTPPVGLNMFIVCSIAKISVWEFSKEVWSFLLALILSLAVVTYVPATVTYLPELIR